MAILETLEKVDKNRLKERLRVPFIGLLVALAIAVSATMDVPPYLKAREAVNWPEAPGISKRSGIARVEIGKDPAWEPIAVYKYEVGNREYVNDVISYQLYIGLPGYEANLMKTRYCPGTSVTVRYNPKDPSDSCIDPDPRLEVVVIHFLIYLLFGVLAYLSTYPPAKTDES